MLDWKTLIAKSSTDAELNRKRDAMRRDEKKHGSGPIPNESREAKQQLGLTFIVDRIVVPTELRKKLLDTLHF